MIKKILITSKASSAVRQAVRQAHGPEQSRRAALPSIAPSCGVLLQSLADLSVL
jgi:hypothetical protein